jgi:fibronectin type 3 domain-containing protein
MVSFSDTGLTSGTTYYYKVTAVSGTGESGKSNETSVQVGASALAAPVDVTAAASSGQVVIRWSSVSGATSYNLYRSIFNGSPVLYQLGLTATSYTDTAVTNGISYGYYVAAVNSAGVGSNSTTVYATPGGASPSAPVGLTAAPSGSTGIYLTWTDVPGSTAYNLYRSTTSGGEGSIPVATSVNASTIGTAMEAYTDSGLAANTTYYYQITAVDSNGEGPKSNEASATTGGAAPSAPAEIKATAGSTQIVVAWSSVTGAATYNLYRNISGGGFSLYKSGLTTTAYTDTGLVTGTTYGYYVAAISSTGQGGNSQIVYATPGDALPPGATGLSGTWNSASGAIALSWIAPPGTIYFENVASFNVYRGTYAGGESLTPIATDVQGTNYTDTNTVNDTEYFYYVTTVTSAGEGAKSNEANVPTGGSPSTGFALLPTPASLTLAPGSKAVIAVQVPGASNFSGPVNLAVTGAPASVAAWCYGPSDTIDPTTHYGEGTNLMVVVSPTATPGNYEIVLTGTAGSTASYAFTNTVTITLTVT